jgi:hypothetical protein
VLTRILKAALTLTIGLIGTTSALAADLPVVVVDESRLPYEFRPSNYDNSPRNYDNSLRNYDNSPRNYDNSERNYDNSASNHDNGRRGQRRLVIQERGAIKVVGYYVLATNGTTNFFSASGKRMFYNPKKGQGVFGGQDGTFCGVLARVDGVLALALTERGMKLLLLSD